MPDAEICRLHWCAPSAAASSTQLSKRLSAHSAKQPSIENSRISGEIMTAANPTPSIVPSHVPTPINTPSGSPKRKKILLSIGGVFVVAAMIFMAYWLVFSRYVEETENAYVQGNVVQV